MYQGHLAFCGVGRTDRFAVFDVSTRLVIAVPVAPDLDFCAFIGGFACVSSRTLLTLLLTSKSVYELLFDCAVPTSSILGW